MATHKDLQVWQLSMTLAEQVYQLTANFPKGELFGMVSQMRRCVVSIPSNIAEGAARQTKKEYVQFLYVSLGSLSELETQMDLATRLHLADSSEISENIEKIRRMLLNLVRYLKESISKRQNQNSNAPTLQRSNAQT